MELLPVSESLDSSSRILAMQILGVVASCRECGAAFSPKVQESFIAGKRVKCTKCDWYGNWRDNTPLTRSTLKNIQFVALFYKFILPDGIAAIAAAMELSPTTVREWGKKIKDWEIKNGR